MAIRQKGKNKYQLVVDYYDDEGKRRRHTQVVTCKGKKAAKDLLDEFADSWEDALPEDTTVGQLIQDYIDSRELKGLKANTIRNYKNVKAKMVEHGIGKKAARDLTTYQIERYIVHMIKEEKLSAKTVKNRISLLRSAYDMAIRSGLLRNNPCTAVELPKLKSPEISILSENEIDLFMEKLSEQNLDIHVLCELALFCGLRRGEILGLTSKDINIDESTIHIRQVRYWMDGHMVIEEPKTEKSKATLSCPRFIMDDIVQLMEEHACYSDCDYLIQYVGEPMKPDYASNKVIQFIDSLNISHVTLHGLRHTFASMLNASGEFDIAEISTAMRHSNITTTMNVYVDVFAGATHSSKRISGAFDEKYGKNGAQNGARTMKKALKHRRFKALTGGERGV